MSLAFRSFILASAIWRTWALVTRAGEVAARRLRAAIAASPPSSGRYDAGGVFISKVKDLSENTVIVTGIGMPFSWSCVLALNALQNSMMLRPRWPKRRADRRRRIGRARRHLQFDVTDVIFFATLSPPP